MRRFLLVDARSRGLAGLFVAGCSVRGGGLFRDRFPGRADACVGYFTLKGSLTYVTARRAVSDRDGFLGSRVEAATRLWSQVFPS